MKKTLLSIAVALVATTSVVADEHTATQIEETAAKAIEQIQSQKELALKELKEAHKTTVVDHSLEMPKKDLPSAEVFQARVNENKNLATYGIEVQRAVTDFGFGDFYEVTLGGRDNAVLHIDQEYLILGDVVKFENGTHNNVSQVYRSELQKEKVKEEVNSLDEKYFISYESTVEQNLGTLYVYTDTTCGYCRKLHLEIDQLLNEGIDVKYIAYPRSGSEEQVPVSRDAEGNLVYNANKGLVDLSQVFCAEDSAQALTDVKAGTAGNKYDTASYKENKASCNEKVSEGYASGKRVGFGGTPFLYLDNGTVVPGYQPATAIIEMFKNTK